ncbi:GH1 family beta-glucosidase [Niveibacterium umoris]|uniref:Beta-glucosidase n=1 Tax=Niveibacterium umoris TaxID=1193620 RepID=A0A840BKA8_9RHOO|nr:GH1 family beta-glucosidase [Niveibacterium umoris]MBB4012854.1 beta-glucosidase [Niveibacterium umoris]
MKTLASALPDAAASAPFPADFIWGVATSAYQIEGAAHEGGRGPSIWDVFAATPGKVAGGDTGEHACDHYHRYREDVALMQSLGVDAYRFSIAWPRVQPDGAGAWNEEGWAFYGRLLDALDDAGIAAHATLYHWDLPQALEDKGGWRNRDTAARFADYAAEFVRRFGERVKTIATHNEPLCTAMIGHEEGRFAPGLKDRKAAYQVAHHLLLSHGLAMQAMRAAGARAALGIVLNQSPAYPAAPTEDARIAARLADAMCNRLFMDPLFRGAYPADLLAHLGADAPVVLPGDMALIGAPLDFLGINYYSRIWAGAPAGQPAPCALGVTDMGWEIYPQGLTEHLVRIARDYNPPPIYITENGAACVDVPEAGAVHDPQRIRFLASHIAALRSAMAQGADVRGYFAWSLLDNFEWDSGYAKRFGLVFVDYPTQQRTLKDSALWYHDWIVGQRRAASVRES